MTSTGFEHRIPLRPAHVGRRGGRAVLTCLVLLLLLSACGLGEGLDAGTGRGSASSPVLPALGTSQIEVSEGRISVRANRAPRRPVLSSLARRVGFQLDVTVPDLAPLTVSIESVEIAQALPQLLEGLHYQADYGYDARRGAHVLYRLRVGRSAGSPVPLGELAEAEEGAADRPGDDRRSGESDSDLLHAERRRTAAERARARERMRDEGDRKQLALVDQLDSRDPALRSQAVQEIEPYGEGLQRLRDLLLEDPDSLVRLAAVEQLEEGETHAAVQGLVDALGDPDRRVVLAAIDALEFAGDESNVADLRGLLDHLDGEIRRAAREAIEFLE